MTFIHITIIFSRPRPRNKHCSSKVVKAVLWYVKLIIKPSATAQDIRLERLDEVQSKQGVYSDLVQAVLVERITSAQVDCRISRNIFFLHRHHSFDILWSKSVVHRTAVIALSSRIVSSRVAEATFAIRLSETNQHITSKGSRLYSFRSSENWIWLA